MSLPRPSKNAYAVITGASQGLGMAMARDLARMGHNLILVARRESILQELAEELESTYPISVEIRPYDLADEQTRHTLTAELRSRTITILINSAGIASFGPFIDQDWDYEITQFHLNATAVFELTAAVIPGMVAGGEGAICNVGSLAGNIPIPNNATYVFTKAGVNTFTEALHYELEGTGVSCTLLSSGPIREPVVRDEDMSIVDRVVPSFMWNTYQSCSKDTLEAMAQNKVRVTPGFLAKFIGFLTRHLPRSFSARIAGQVYAKMA